MNKKEFVNMMVQHPELESDLFIRGFLITDKKFNSLDDFPFYGNWKVEAMAGFYFMSH